jgi:hypothetical protein
MGGETEQEVSGWTVDTLRMSMQRQLDDFRERMQERYETQTKAVDAAFLAQQTAMQTALTAAERAVQTALLSAEKAVTKAELAADKRFDAVNEFRGQLADQAAQFMPREVADALFAELRKKIDENTARLNKGTGSTDARERSQDRSQPWQIWVAGLILTALIVVSNHL